jgi:hypothetical protein
MSRFTLHPLERAFAEQEQERKLAWLRQYWSATLAARAERNKVIRADPAAWRAAEMELRRAGEFERAVHCQRVADDLEAASQAPREG